MKIVVQRSLKSNVIINDKINGEINFGLVLLVGFTHNDNLDDIKYMINKIINLRIFDDENGIMNKSILDVNGEILSISQFTLYGDARKGRRPSYAEAMEPSKATVLYDQFNELLRNENIKVATGMFGSEMVVNIKNDGPVTILLESRSLDVQR